MPRFLVRKKEKSLLELVDAMEIEAFQYIPLGKLFLVDITIDRNLDYHRKFRGFLNELYENMPSEFYSKYPSFEVFYKNILVATGFYNYTKKADVLHIEYKSTAFDAMDEIEYRNLVHSVIRLIDAKYYKLDDKAYKGLIELLHSYNYY